MTQFFDKKKLHLKLIISSPELKKKNQIESSRIIYLTRNTALAGDATFVWNDKFVLRPADTLKLTTAGTSDLNILVSYIDQDWS